MNRGSSKQDYATPSDFMKAVTRRFGIISFDLAAHSKNKQHDNYFSILDNSLIQEWHKIPGWLWLNPPFDNIAPWAMKCQEEMRKGAKILFLTPASIGSNWFALHVNREAVTLGLNGRLSFDGIAPYPKDCQLSVFAHRLTGFDTWRWTEDVT